MLNNLWAALRGRHTAFDAPPGVIIGTIVDDPSEAAETDALPGLPHDLAGFACVIDYCDARGRSTRRRISIIRLEEAAGTRYLRAYCHERAAARVFRVDRIAAVFDGETGELFDSRLLFEARDADRVQLSALTWGLPPRRRADLLALLNALVFIARCDREWHPLEEETIERFVTSYWLRAELAGQPPIADILHHARRLRPDPEAFFGSLLRAQQAPTIAPMLRSMIGQMITADDHIAPEEHHWAVAVDDFLRENS